MTRHSGFWLLIHQIPPAPAYLRVKVGRQLQRVGAIAIKSSVYALPKNDVAREHLGWILKEITDGGGDGSICEARFAFGLSDAEVESMFNAARDADYAALEALLGELERPLAKRVKPGDTARVKLLADLQRARRRAAEIAEIDFFGAPRRGAAEARLAKLEARLEPSPELERSPLEPRDYRGRVWVTRKGVHVDRMASAWLVRRFVDANATFKFVGGKTYEPRAKEVRFDMFGGELTHEGDLCTFEVICRRFGLTDRGLAALGEVVHEIDLRDRKFERPETPGLALVIAAIASAHREDEARLDRSAALFDDLHAHYRNRKREGEP